MVESRIAQAILEMAQAHGLARSFSPTDVAQVLAPEAWRGQLTAVRKAAQALAKTGAIEVLRKGKPVAGLDEVRGVIRLRLAGAGAAVQDAPVGE